MLGFNLNWVAHLGYSLGRAGLRRKETHITFQNYSFTISFTISLLCYFCVSVLSVFFAIKLITF